MSVKDLVRVRYGPTLILLKDDLNSGPGEQGPGTAFVSQHILLFLSGASFSNYKMLIIIGALKSAL